MIELVLGIVPEDKYLSLTHTRTHTVFGDLSRLKGSALLLANGKWVAGNLWYVMESEGIKLSPVVNCDAMSMEANTLRLQAAARLNC